MEYIRKRANIVNGFSHASLGTLIILIIMIGSNTTSSADSSNFFNMDLIYYGVAYAIAYIFSFVASVIILATDWKSKSLQSSKYGYGIPGISILTLLGFGWIIGLAFASKAKSIANKGGTNANKTKRAAIDPTTFDTAPSNTVIVDEDMYL